MLTARRKSGPEEVVYTSAIRSLERQVHTASHDLRRTLQGQGGSLIVRPPELGDISSLELSVDVERTQTRYVERATCLEVRRKNTEMMEHGYLLQVDSRSLVERLDL